jgi:hypothetical protein
VFEWRKNVKECSNGGRMLRSVRMEEESRCDS